MGLPLVVEGNGLTAALLKRGSVMLGCKLVAPLAYSSPRLGARMSCERFARIVKSSTSSQVAPTFQVVTVPDVL